MIPLGITLPIYLFLIGLNLKHFHLFVYWFALCYIAFPIDAHTYAKSQIPNHLYYILAFFFKLFLKPILSNTFYHKVLLHLQITKNKNKNKNYSLYAKGNGPNWSLNNKKQMYILYVFLTSMTFRAMDDII